MQQHWIEKKIDNIKIPIYDKSAFDGLRKAGLLAYQTLEYIKNYVKEGVSTDTLNQMCHDFIIKNNAIPATLGYNGYPKSSCISLNHEICHGIPSEKKLRIGDILNIDVTVLLNGWFGDTSSMFSVGKTSALASNLMRVTKECLDESIKILQPGISLNSVGDVIQSIAHHNRFSVVEAFCGHGIGHKFHQEPNVLHYSSSYGKNFILEAGMVFTIEPMINTGKKDIKLLPNGWTAITKDFSLSAQYEHTIGITDNGYVVFTSP